MFFKLCVWWCGVGLKMVSGYGYVCVDVVSGYGYVCVDVVSGSQMKSV
jgi:hypothetical protein